MTPIAYVTTHTPIAVALLTAGVGPALIDERQRLVHRQYDENHPMRRDAQGRPTSPGQVTYLLDMQASDGTATKDLASAYERGTSDAELDAAIDALPEPYREKIRKLLPLAYMAHARVLLQNRGILMRIVNGAPAFLRLRRPDGSYTLQESQEWERATAAEKERLLRK